MRYTQPKYFNSGDPDNPHPRYGPCDGFGPDGTCSECTGLIGRADGSIIAWDGRLVRRRPLLTRLRSAVRELKR